MRSDCGRFENDRNETMTELLTAAQMRAIEQAAIASGEVTGLELMERAGRGVVEAIFDEWPELKATSHRAVVLCGPGNNGGDGFVVARLLKERGWEVEVFLYGDPERLPPDARANYERWRGMGEVTLSFSVPPLTQMEIVESLIGEEVPLVAVDALFGIGATRGLPDAIGPLDFLFRNRVRHRHIRRVAVDLPSGVCADSGADLGNRFFCELTVTFHRAKIGHLVADGPEGTGKLHVVDLGLPRSFVGVELVEPYPREITKHSGHKYSHGHALILSGPPGRGGAARLAARGALRIGAGVVTVGSPPEAVLENAARLDAVMLRPIAEADVLARVLEDKRINALCLGPGMGTGAREAGLLAVALGLPAIPPPPSPPHGGEGGHEDGSSRAGGDDEALPLPLAGSREGRGERSSSPVEGEPPASASGTGGTLSARTSDAPPPPSPPHEGEGGHDGQPSCANADGEALPLPPVGRGEGWGAAPPPARRPMVLDADALTILSRNPHLFAALHKNCVLTPHAGEFARLFPDIAAKLAEPATTGPAYSKVDATREAAARAGCVVLYKGPDTVIADPRGRCAINSAAYDRAAPWLATAGSGDVLAGFITGLLARGLSPFDAACTGAWLHVECARSFGPGLIAEDLPEELPKVFQALGV
jgi:hydroxyethylthiazole kinase-like uncharacterized protein yjeF